MGKREIYAITTAYTEPVTVLRLHRDGKAQLFINALVLLSLGFALAAGASNVAAPSPAQHYTTVPYPSCGFEFSATAYKAAVDSATANRQTYSPGDTITISGSVELQAYTYSYDSCSCYPGYWSRIDPSTASVYLELFVNSKWTSASNSLHPDSSGHFSLTYHVPGDQPVGTLNFRVTASPARISYGGCSPFFTPDDALGLKTVQVSIQSIPLSATLIVTPLSGQAPFTPSTWSGSHSGGQGPFTQVIDWGDGASDDVSNCGQNCPVHTYPNPGTYTITFKVTDSNGKTASDSKTITVLGTSSTSTSSPGVTLIPAIENVCNPAITIFMMIFAIIVTIIIIRILRRWILGLFPRAALILTIILSIMIAAALILVIGNVCTPALTVVAVIIILVFIMIIFRGRILGPPWPPPPPPPPPGGNVTGNATLTGPNGAQTQLTGGNLNQVGPGTTVQTTGGSFVRVPTPQGSNSQSVIGQDSRVSWLDPNFLTQIPWLRFPGLSQIYNAGSVLLRLDFGKLLLSWVESAESQEAVIILPASLIGAATAAAMSRWLARIKGTMVLVEAVQNGTAAAVTVLQGEEGKESSVELWRSDNLNKVIQIHAGERVVLKADRNPTKIKVNLPMGLAQQIQDPFGVLHKYWTIPPMSDETNAALTTLAQTHSGTLGERTCARCGRRIPNEGKFCTYCGAEQTSS